MTLILWRDVWFSSAAVLLGFRDWGCPKKWKLRGPGMSFVRSQSREFAFNLATSFVFTCFGESILNWYQPLGGKFPTDSTTKNVSFILFHFAERFGSSPFWCVVFAALLRISPTKSWWQTESASPYPYGCQVRQDLGMMPHKSPTWPAFIGKKQSLKCPIFFLGNFETCNSIIDAKRSMMLDPPSKRIFEGI